MFISLLEGLAPGAAVIKLVTAISNQLDAYDNTAKNASNDIRTLAAVEKELDIALKKLGDLEPQPEPEGREFLRKIVDQYLALAKLEKELSSVDYAANLGALGPTNTTKSLEIIKRKKRTIRKILDSGQMILSGRWWSPPWNVDPSEFLAFFNCDVIPNVLLIRASEKSAFQWNDAGEIIQKDRTNTVLPIEFEELSNILSSIESRRSELGYNFEDPPWSAAYIITDELRGCMSCNHDPATLKCIQFMILNMVIFALPEPWCEILWDEIEDQIWEVVQSTCVPFLAVLTMEDIEVYILQNARGKVTQYQISLLKLLIRVSTRLKSATPQGILDLISDGLAIVELDNMIEKENIALHEELKYLQVLNQVSQALAETIGQPSTAIRALQQINQHGNSRSNATIGLSLGTLLNVSENPRNDFLQDEWSWKPISFQEPSTMELLAQAIVRKDTAPSIPKTKLENTPLELKVLFAFCDLKRSSFQTAFAMLFEVTEEVKRVYGPSSQELLLVGAAFINCCNSTRREDMGETTGRRVARPGLFILDEGNKIKLVSIKNPSETYFLLALSDSLLGQSSYTEATNILSPVFESTKTPLDISTRAALRLCKLDRRIHQSVTHFESWSRLEKAVQRFYDVSDILKYEILEEVICFLSVLIPEDVAKIPQLPYIVRELTKYQIRRFKGSFGSRQNLLDNLQSMQQYRNNLGLFCIYGPELNYSRAMRDAFPKAEIYFVEMIGGLNWDRFKRVRALQDAAELGEKTISGLESEFHDSGFGSSMDTQSRNERETLRTQAPKVYVRSEMSVNSNLSTKTSSMRCLDMPLETHSLGQRYCYVCKRLIRGISNRKQWERHIFSDIRPYTCIIDGCNVDSFQFASRNEFQAHLIEHQTMEVWKCKRCHHTEGSRYAIESHMSNAHPYSCNDTFLEFQETRRSLANLKCPFCMMIPGAASFVGHICHHLEEVALFAIPRDTIEYSDEPNSTDCVSGGPFQTRRSNLEDTSSEEGESDSSGYTLSSPMRFRIKVKLDGITTKLTAMIDNGADGDFITREALHLLESPVLRPILPSDLVIVQIMTSTFVPTHFVRLHASNSEIGLLETLELSVIEDGGLGPLVLLGRTFQTKHRMWNLPDNINHHDLIVEYGSGDAMMEERANSFDPKEAANLKEEDQHLISELRQWNDAPSVPHTSKAAMKKFKQQANNISIASSAATWGTRRRSEPSLADFDAVADGSFLKRLTITKTREGGRVRQGTSLLKPVFGRLTKMFRKRTDSDSKISPQSDSSPQDGMNENDEEEDLELQEEMNIAKTTCIGLNLKGQPCRWTLTEEEIRSNGPFCPNHRAHAQETPNEANLAERESKIAMPFRNDPGMEY